MLAQLNDQRGKLQTMLENLEENPWTPAWPIWPYSCF